jgi:hypothetical protein
MIGKVDNDNPEQFLKRYLTSFPKGNMGGFIYEYKKHYDNDCPNEYKRGTPEFWYKVIELHQDKIK